VASIQRRARQTGAYRYRVQVRQQGQRRSATFATRAQARQWAQAVESGMPHPLAAAEAVTLGA